METAVLDVKGLAEALGVGINTARDIMRRADFPAVRIGRVYRVRRADLERWWAEHAGAQIATSNTGRGARRPRVAAPSPQAAATLDAVRKAVAR